MQYSKMTQWEEGLPLMNCRTMLTTALYVCARYGTYCAYGRCVGSTHNGQSGTRGVRIDLASSREAYSPSCIRYFRG